MKLIYLWIPANLALGVYGRHQLEKKKENKFMIQVKIEALCRMMRWKLIIYSTFIYFWLDVDVATNVSGWKKES